MQQVVFSWIVVGELGAGSEAVGVAQTSLMLPALFLLLFGGAVADRFDPRRLLIGIHLIAAVPVLLLSGASALGWVEMPVLVAYGLAFGTVAAFAMPARDTLLSRVAGGDMLHAVTSMTAVQFGAQAAGTLAAGLTRFTGSAAMLAIQALVLLFGSWATLHVPPRRTPRPPRVDGRTALHEIREGLGIVARDPHLRGPVVLVVAVGVFFVGSFVVVVPLLVRDYYQAGVDRLAFVYMLFPLGTIVGSLVLRARGLRRRGASALLSLVVGAAALAAIGTGVSFPVMTGLTLVWGLAASVFINASRTIFQEAAPAEQRGRALSVYQLGFMGGGPIGALLAGFVSGRFGLHTTLLAASGAMLLLVAVMTFGSDLRRID